MDMRPKVDIAKPVPVMLCAIMCITVLEVVALLQGIDGMLFMGAVATIAALGGVTAGTLWRKVNNGAN